MGLTRNYAIAFTAAIGGFMATLELTVVNVALFTMAKGLGTDLATIQWVVTGSFLAVATVIPVAGYLGNRYGLRRLFLVAVTCFTVGSLLCGLSTDIRLLLVFRVLQGLGGGAIIPLGQAIALSPFAPEERAKALSIVAFPILLAPAIGPSLGGLLTEHLGWQWIFFLNLPLGVLCLILTWLVIPKEEVQVRTHRSSFDWVGLLLSILGVVLVVYGLNVVSQVNPATQTPQHPQGAIYGWGYWLVWILLGSGLAVLGAFTWYELRHPDPVLDLRLFGQRDFLLTSVLSWLARAVSYAALLLIPVFLQQIHQPHLTVQETGLFLIPQGLASAVGVLVGMALYRRFGARVSIVIGVLILILSSWPLTQLSVLMDVTSLQLPLILRGLAVIAIFLPAQTLAFEHLQGARLAKGTSLYNVTVQMFSSVGVAFATSLFVQRSTFHALELARQVPPGQTLAQAATRGLNDVFVVALLGAVVLLIPALFLPGKRSTAKPQEVVAEPVVLAE